MKENNGVWKFISAILATALLSSGAWWFAVGNKLHACEEAMELKAEFEQLKISLDNNTHALNQTTVVLRAYGITMDNLAPKREESP